MTKRILVTGAAGFIGSHTVDALLRAGHDVCGIDNYRTGRRENLAAAANRTGFRMVELDLLNEKAFSECLSDYSPDAIIHLAALVSVQESIVNCSLNYSLNLHLTHMVSEAARRAGTKRIVFASSAAVYGNLDLAPLAEDTNFKPISPYGAAKLASEVILFGYGSTFGYTVRCQRYFNVYGPRQDPTSPYSGVISLFDAAFRGKKPVTIFGDGEQTRDFIFVEDVALANMLAATRPDLSSGTANIGTGRETSLNSLVRSFQDAFSCAVPVQYKPERVGDIRRSCARTVRAELELGFVAATSVKQGLMKLLPQ